MIEGTPLFFPTEKGNRSMLYLSRRTCIDECEQLCEEAQTELGAGKGKKGNQTTTDGINQPISRIHSIWAIRIPTWHRDVYPRLILLPHWWVGGRRSGGVSGNGERKPNRNEHSD
jgi:hypothetical protein